MSVLLETSLGDIVIDLDTSLCPTSTLNFLKLCSIHYYIFSPFHSVQKNFIAQTGDPNGTGKGGQSIFSLLPKSSSDHSDSKYFTPDLPRQLNHSKRGTVSFSCSQQGEEEGDLVTGSQFFITLQDGLDYLDGKHAPFGTVVEGLEEGGTIEKIDKAFVDEGKRPLRDIRILRAVVLDDPFPDPPSFSTLLPSRTPSPTPLQLANSRLDASLPSPTSSNPEDEEEENERKRQSEKNSAALTLEMVGDLPFAEVRPPENILFVCKLNPVTRSEDLELIFSRFGKVLSCEVVKDRKTGDSLQYAFIEFDEQKSAEQAYFKMQSVLIDDRRIQVDFSQSVSKLHGDWLFKRSGGKLGNRLGGDERSQSSRNGDSRRGGGMVFDFDDRERNRGSGSGRRDDRRDGRRRDDKDDRRRDGRDDRRRDDRDDRRQDGDDRNRSRGGSSYQTSRNDHQSSPSRTKSRWDDRDGRKEEVRREKRDGRRERSPRDSRSGRDERGREDHSGR